MYRCVNKNDEKGYFYQAGQCAVLIIQGRKNVLFLGFFCFFLFLFVFFVCFFFVFFFFLVEKEKKNGYDI